MTRDHVDEEYPARSHEILTVVHNLHGEIEEQTQFDYLPGEPNPLRLKTAFGYDDWEQRCCIVHPDGVQEHTTSNPIGNRDFQGVQRRTWLQGPGSKPQISGKRELWLNRFEKPVRERRLSADDAVLAEQTRDYDGLGNCTSHCDERGSVSGYAYDSWNRLISTRLADGTLVARDYQAYSSETLTRLISVTAPLRRMHCVGL